jgi:ABC-type polar amino acid transport system ATPase subunit
MYVYRIQHVQFNDGTTLEPGKLTIICGPNNVGKSRALKDLEMLSTRHAAPYGVIIKDVQHVLPQNLDELRQAYDVERYRQETGHWLVRTLDPKLCSEYKLTTGADWPASNESSLRYTDNAQRSFASDFGHSMLAHLTTDNRLQLVKESSSASDEHQIANLLQALYAAGPSAEKLIRAEVRTAFGCEVALDFTAPQKLLLRVGDDFSSLPADPREARCLLSNHEKLDDQGDGLRAFVGVVVALLVIKRGLFLIDEPETFLHPPQAFRIGEFLATNAGETTQLVIATHSADFLRGVLSKTHDVTVIRVDRNGDKNEFRRLEPIMLKNLASDPLLSSARVLDGLFYAGAVVVEADRDARFYQSVFKKRFPDTDLHFVNADNKQTVPKITRLYRDLGVKCCGIVDFDALNETYTFASMLDTLGMTDTHKKLALEIRDKIGAEAKEIPDDRRFAEAVAKIGALSKEAEVQAASITEGLPKFLSDLDGKCREIVHAAKQWKELKEKGIYSLPEPLVTEFWKLYELCVQYGLIITPTGELESMLVEYGIERTTDKRAWIIRALTLIPSLEPNDLKYPWKLVKLVSDNLRR